MSVRAVRGAVTVEEDRRDAVLDATRRVLEEILRRNRLDQAHLVSVFLTATGDIRSAFPAEAARDMGLTKVPLLCAREMDVEGSMPLVIRVLVHFQSDAALEDVEHVYLGEAKRLRDDLS